MAAALSFPSKTQADVTLVGLEHLSVAVDPGIVRAGETIAFRVTFPQLPAGSEYILSDPAGGGEPYYKAVVYRSENPTSVGGSWATVGEQSIDQGTVASGFSKSWNIPSNTQPGMYGYSAKIFMVSTGNYVEGSLFESRFQIQDSGSSDATACSSGSGCVISASSDKQSANAGESINFQIDYSDNAEQSGNYRYDLLVSVSEPDGSDPNSVDYAKKCGEWIDNRVGSPKTCAWPTAGGSGGTSTGNHLVVIKVYRVDLTPESLYAVSYLTVYINNPDVPNEPPDRPPLLRLDATGFTAGNGSDATQFDGANLLDRTTVVGKILDFVFRLIGILSFVGIVLGGFQIITSAGNPTLREKGKKSIMFSVIGFVLAALAYSIVRVVNFILGLVT